MPQHLRKSKDGGDERVTFLLPVELRSFLVKEAEAEDRTLSQHMRFILRHWRYRTARIYE